MKKFIFELEVTVYADTEDEARELFCDDSGSWEFDEDDLLCIAVEDLDVVVEPPGESTTDSRTLVSTAVGILEGMTADERVDLFREIAGDYCIDCGYKQYGSPCHCMNDT